MPLTGQGLGRLVEIQIALGETELHTQSRQIEPVKGEWVMQTFDFLSKDSSAHNSTTST
jgi:hypothetical protein